MKKYKNKINKAFQFYYKIKANRLFLLMAYYYQPQPILTTNVYAQPQINAQYSMPQAQGQVYVNAPNVYANSNSPQANFSMQNKGNLNATNQPVISNPYENKHASQNF